LKLWRTMFPWGWVAMRNGTRNWMDGSRKALMSVASGEGGGDRRRRGGGAGSFGSEVQDEIFYEKIGATVPALDEPRRRSGRWNYQRRRRSHARILEAHFDFYASRCILRTW